MSHKMSSDDSTEKFSSNKQRTNKPDKKKHHRHGYNEDVQESRRLRVGFKKYLQSLEEQLLDDELDENLK